MIGRARGMRYAGSDDYHALGVKLRKQPDGSYTLPNQKYIPQSDNCSLPENEPCSWRNDLESGGSIFFGSSDNSRVMAEGKNGYRVWAADKVSNPRGLYYTIQYFKTDGELYPERITYTFGPTSQLYKHVEFFYEDNPQAQTIYSDGVPVILAKRLKSIEVRIDRYCADLWVTTVCFGENVFRRYMLNYTSSPSTDRALLSGVEIYDENGALLPASAVFSYSGGKVAASYQVWPAGTTQHMHNGGGSQRGYVTITGDFNGDGVTDLATVHKPQAANGWSQWIAVEISTKTGFRSEVWPSSAVQQMYVSGGGWSEWFAVERSTGVGFISETWHTPTAAALASSFGDYTVLPGDFNGDGRIDLATVQQVNTRDEEPCEDMVYSWCHGGSGDMASPWARGIYVDLNTGNGFVSQYWRAAAPAYMAASGNTLDHYKILPIDINLDGKTDLVFARANAKNWTPWSGGVFRMEISTGNGFVAEVRSSSLIGWMTNGGLGTEYELVAGDLNADGMLDLAVVTKSVHPGKVAVELSQGNMPDQLVTVQSVHGIREEMTYQVSTALPNAHRSKNGFYSYPFRQWTFPQSVLVSHKLWGNGKLQSHFEFDYRYAKAFVEKTGNLRFLGFGEMIEYDRLRSRKKETLFHQEPGYAMKPRWVSVYLSSGKVLSTEEYRAPLWLIEAWERMHPNEDLPELSPALAYMRQEAGENGYVTSKILEPVPTSFEVETPKPRLFFHREGSIAYKTILKYDGNRIIEKGISTDSDYDSLLQLSRFNDFTQLNTILDNLPQQQVMSIYYQRDGSRLGSPLDWVRYYYGSNMHKPDRVLHFIGRMNGPPNLWQVTTYQYQQAGLVVAEGNGNNLSGKIYSYDDGRFGQFVISTRECAAYKPGENGECRDISFSDYDPRFGKPIMVGHYNHSVEVTHYDTQGRVIEVRKYDNRGRMLRKATTTYSENSDGIRVRNCQYYGENFEQASCALTITDSFGRELLRVTPATQGEENSPAYSAVKIEYDALFRKVRESLPYFSDADGNGTPVSWISYTYDEQDRVTSVTAADGSKTRFEYNKPFSGCRDAVLCWPPQDMASRVTTIEPNGKRKDIYKNAQGKPLLVIDDAGL